MSDLGFTDVVGLGTAAARHPETGGACPRAPRRPWLAPGAPGRVRSVSALCSAAAACGVRTGSRGAGTPAVRATASAEAETHGATQPVRRARGRGGVAARRERAGCTGGAYAARAGRAGASSSAAAPETEADGSAKIVRQRLTAWRGRHIMCYNRSVQAVTCPTTDDIRQIVAEAILAERRRMANLLIHAAQRRWQACGAPDPIGFEFTRIANEIVDPET